MWRSCARNFAKANLPETRADEFLTALREIIRNYQVAADTLAAVINKESQGTVRAVRTDDLAKDDAEVDALREKLAALRTQAQTVRDPGAA